MTTSTPDLVIFDLGQVVIRLDWQCAFESWHAASGVHQDTLAACLISDDSFLAYERGHLDDAAFIAHACNTLGMSISPDQFVAGWNAIFRDPLHEVVAWLEALPSQTRIVALSNTNAIHERHLRHRYHKELGHFDQLYLSHLMDSRKPEAACFQQVLQEQNVTPEQCLFFDDLGDNVAAAAQLGIRATQVHTPDDVTQVLSNWFVLT